MRKLIWTPAVVAALAIFACSSSNKGSGNSFPYSGPSCPNGQPGNLLVSAACVSCLENACPPSASDKTCVNSTCSSYYNCYCGCMQGSTSCYSGCQQQQSSACTTCMASQSTCSAQSVASCASECTPDAGSGGTATGTCATLMSCCAGTAAAQACNLVVNMNNQGACQLFLSGLQDAGVCH